MENSVFNYVTEDEQQEAIEVGAYAESLLNSEAFVSVITKLKADSIQAMLMSRPDQTEDRERTYYFCNALTEIEKELQSLVAKGKQTLIELEKQTEGASQDDFYQSPDSPDKWY